MLECRPGAVQVAAGRPQAAQQQVGDADGRALGEPAPLDQLEGLAAAGRRLGRTGTAAADATAHVLENPFAPGFMDGQPVAVTLVLVALLGAVFLKGFTEAVGIAVVLVAAYLALNLVVVLVALEHVLADPQVVTDWRNLLTTEHASPLGMVAVALLVFPKLALALSGFETGVAVMPLVRGAPGDTPGAAPRPHPRHPQAAHHRGPDHERVPRHQQLRPPW